MESPMGKRSGAKLAVVIVAAVLLILLLAAPAMAAPFATSLVASPAQATIDIGDEVTISAVLTDTDNAVPVTGEVVRVEQAATSGGPWTLLNYADAQADGVYSLELYPTQTAYYRFVYAPDPVDTYAPSTSNVISVVVTPLPTSLTASPGQTTVKFGASPTIGAVLTNTDESLPVGGEELRVEQATSSDGPWALVQTVTNDGTSGTYSLAVTPTHTTYYRFVFAGTGTYAAATSNVLTVEVTPLATSLTASPSKTTAKFGADPTISAVLMNTDGVLPIGGALLRVEQAASSGGPWSLVQTVTNDGTSGVYSLAVMPARTMYYRFAFAGTDAYAAVTSDVLTVEVKPVLGTPTSPSSVKKNKSFTVKVTVKPGAPDGPAVKIQAYRKHDGKWSKYKSAYSTTRSGTTCSAKIKISATGQFKFKATVAQSSKFVGVTSSYSKVMKVKK